MSNGDQDKDSGWGTSSDAGWGSSDKTQNSGGGWGSDNNKAQESGGWGSSDQAQGSGGWGSGGQGQNSGGGGGFGGRGGGGSRGRGSGDRGRGSRGRGGGGFGNESRDSASGGWGSDNKGSDSGGWGGGGSSSGGGGGGRACYNCGESGHMSRDCPAPKKQGGGGGGGGGGGRSCYNCGESGHISRDCPAPKKQGGRGGNSNSGGGGWGSDTKTQESGGGWGSDNKASDSGGWGSDNKASDSGGWGGGGSSSGGGGWASDNKGSDSGGWGSAGADNGDRPQKSGWSSNAPEPERKRFKREGEDGNEEGERPAPYKPDELDLDEEAKLYENETGQNFQNYNDQKVTCLPKDIITPVEKFRDVLASNLLLKNIESQKYTEMTPIQRWAMPTIMEGHDLIACAQTGSGKTAAFLLPVLQNLLNSDLEPHDPNSDCQNPYCLILSPTRELANQIYVHANMLSKDSIIKCHVIYGQISTAHLKSKLSSGCHILVATIGRLKDFVQRGWIGFKNIKYLILDEGDRLVDEGFSADVQNLFNHETMPTKDTRQTLFFSATFKEETQLHAKQYLKDKFIFLSVGKVGAANVDIKQEFLVVSRQDKKRELKTILMEVPEEDKCIIFTQTKTAADMLAGFFTALNLSSTSIHGDRHQSQREQAIKAFRRGEKRFLISSPVGNRGLDLPKVSLVINYDLPSCIDEYVHRIGRTGRAGHVGRALSFYDEERDRELLPGLIEILTEAKQDIPEWMTSNGVTANNDDFTSTSEDKTDNNETNANNDGWGTAAW